MQDELIKNETAIPDEINEHGALPETGEQVATELPAENSAIAVSADSEAAAAMEATAETESEPAAEQAEKADAEETSVEPAEPTTEAVVNTETIEEAVESAEITAEAVESAEVTAEEVEPVEPVNDVSIGEILEEAAEIEKDFVSETPEEIDRKELLNQLFGQNAEDTAERADEVGVSGVYDAYRREIIPSYFENRLRMSVNTLKLYYSKLKNTVLSYKETKQKFDTEGESYFLKGEEVARAEMDGDKLYFFLAISDELDKKAYPHKLMAEARYEYIPVRVIVKSRTNLIKALELIAQMMEKKGAQQRTVFVPTAYAERYPFNPDAVLKGQENEPPEEGAFDGEEYEPITDENVRNIVEEKVGKKKEGLKGKEKLEDMRQTATSIKAALALTEPIVYFYDTALDKENKIAFLNVQMVLTDKFLGRMLPQQYFAVAEGSDKIEKLNLIALKDIAEDCKRYPNWKFALQMSCRMLTKQSLINKILKETEGINNFILAFDCAFLEALGDVGLKGINALREANIDIMIDNAENAGMKVLTEYNYQYLRLDSRYYGENDLRKTAHLDVITGFARNQAIITVGNNAGTLKEAKYFLAHGVDAIQGEAVCSPKRVAAVAAKEIRKLPQVTQ